MSRRAELRPARHQRTGVGLRDSRDRIIVAQAEPGSQVLVWIYSTGQVEVALRGRPGETWGPPLKITEDSWSVASVLEPGDPGRISTETLMGTRKSRSVSRG